MNKEYEHIKERFNDLRTIPLNSTKWWDKFRWLRDRIHNSWRTGVITLTDRNEFMELLTKFETKAKKETGGC